jgi:D-3-phosphoglycerate dehydrogenase
MMKILVSDQLSEEGLKILKEVKEFKVEVKTDLKPDELKEVIKDYDALIVRSATKVTQEIISAALRLKVIGRAGVGLDNVDLKAATGKGIMVMNTPAGNTVSTAEHTMSMLLALSRNIPGADASLKSGQWQRSKFMGVELYAKTLGIIGLGRIGREVAKRAASFDMKVIAYDPFLSKEVANQIGIELVELEELFKRSDYISAHTPLTSETRHLISEKEIALMKKGVRLVNCARGGIIDEEALLKCLDSGKVAGAALDVFEKEPPDFSSPLLKHKNVVITPHLGASTEEAQVNVAIEICESVRDALLNKGVRNAANFPCLAQEVCQLLQPYIILGEKLGMLATQLFEGRVSELKINYTGEIIKYDLSPLTMAIVKGVLSPILQETVNYINAKSLARERGINLLESKSEKEEDFTNLISLELNVEGRRRKVAGTLFTNNEPRIVNVDGLYVETIPQGYMLFLENWDKPGVIGSLGTLMGKNKINIAGMTFGRDKPGGKAVSALNIDSPVSAKILDEIRKLDNILSVKLIKL